MISTIYTQANQYRVILEHGVEGGVGLAALNNIRLRSNQNTMVPLTILAKVEQSYGPLSINHLAQFPSATFSFNVAKGSSLEGAVNTCHRSCKTDPLTII
ncbi:efflux RND transporter permease subunit [Arsenophonus sp. PmNCSU2021_1]|uniref:efflux RND transporter permease subunit n=1 Tax=Arsenophonus sp. PmNCSU2021_1 TaxID=3118989 RepID=UPI003FA55F99